MQDVLKTVGTEATGRAGSTGGAPLDASPRPRTPVRREREASAARVRLLALAGLFAAVIAVSSWVSVPLPFSPVPLTLQTLAVLVTGGLLGRAWGPVCVLVYLLVGLVGVPVFSSFGAGPGVLFGPTGGYLFGFVGAAFLMGVAGDRVRSRGHGEAGRLGVLVVGAVAASVAIYAVGVPWLALVTGMGVRAALAAGMVPYLVGDAVKAAAAVALVRSVDAALSAQGVR